MFIDIWVYHRSPFHFEMAKITIAQKVFLVIRILIAIIFAAVAVPVTIWLAVDRRYIADIVCCCYLNLITHVSFGRVLPLH